MIYLSLCLIMAVLTGLVARAKGSSWVLWGILGAVFPFLALAGVVLYRHESDELRRECPNCQRICKLYDAICVGCGAELDFPDRAIESEADAARRIAPVV